MRFWGLLGAGIVGAIILAIKLDGQAFALLVGLLAMALLAIPGMMLFASRNQYALQRAPVQQQQPVAPVVIVLASQPYQQPQLSAPQWPTYPQWQGEQQPVDVWEEEAQPQRRFKIVGQTEAQMDSEGWGR